MPMQELKCKNCSGTDFEVQRGIYVCTHCGSKFLFDDPVTKKIEKYEDKMLKAFQKDDYEKALRYSDDILSLDETHAYAWAVRMGNGIADGISLYNAPFIVEAAENALKYAKEDEIDDIRSFVSTHIRLYGDKLTAEDASLKDRIKALSA